MYPDPEIVFQMLADTTRLRIVALLQGHGELCVCELTHTLSLSQPKISRHLAIMREANLLQDRKSGLWVYYRLNNNLPYWAYECLKTLRKASLDQSPYNDDAKLLASSEVKELSNCS